MESIAKNPSIRVALIEDDRQMCEILTEYLKAYAIETQYFRLPKEGIRAIDQGGFDIVILDINLPQMEGLEVCQILKERHKIPIIIISARGSVSDRVLGLELGADDYLPKPFDPRELVARIRAALRKESGNTPLALGSKRSFGVFVLDEEALEIDKEGEAIPFTKGEYEVFALLLKHEGKALTRDFIVDNTEALRWESVGKSVDTIIGRIRAKIGDDPKNPRYIKSVRGVGYRFGR